MTSRADWEARVSKELDGKSAETLSTALPEGFSVPALAPDASLAGGDPSAPGVWPYRRGFRGAALVRNMSCVDVTDPAWAANAQEDLAGGADSLWLVGDAKGPAAEDVARALGERPAGLVGLDFRDSARTAGIAEALEGRGVQPILFIDPLARDVPRFPFAIPTHAWRTAGAHGVLEIALAAAAGAEMLRRASNTADVARRLGFSVAVGRDVLVEIAKLRALRIVWSKVLAAFDLDAEHPWIHAASSPDVLARRGPLNNLLRGTTHAFAAICGGADAVTVLPFDVRRGKPSPEARRAARHTVTILRDECSVAAVRDPAGGAPAVELLTDQLARAAWEKLRAIEVAGGLASFAASSQLPRELEAARAARSALPLVGETESLDPDDVPVAAEARP